MTQFHKDLTFFLNFQSLRISEAMVSHFSFYWSLSLTFRGQVHDLHVKQHVKKLTNRSASVISSCLFPRLVFIGSPVWLFPEMTVTLLAILSREGQRYLPPKCNTTKQKQEEKLGKIRIKGLIISTISSEVFSGKRILNQKFFLI